jgi:DNA-binding transcriptional MerR regulator
MSAMSLKVRVGQLATRTGVPARTIRFWSDAGLVPPAGRSGSGYRLYDADAAARLELVMTLRELGLGLDVVQAVLSRARTVAEVAAAHPGWSGTGSCWPSSTAGRCRRPWCRRSTG